MSSVNCVLLLGHLTRDPELRYTPTGAAVAQFGLGVNRRWRDAAGTLQASPCFVEAVDHLVRPRPHCRWDWTPRVPWRQIGGVAPDGPDRPRLDGPVAGARRQLLPGVTDDPRSGFWPSEPAFRRAPTDPGALGPWGRTIMDRGRGPRGGPAGV